MKDNVLIIVLIIQGIIIIVLLIKLCFYSKKPITIEEEVNSIIEIEE
jgi:hypothetical protein